MYNKIKICGRGYGGCAINLWLIWVFVATLSFRRKDLGKYKISCTKHNGQHHVDNITWTTKFIFRNHITIGNIKESRSTHEPNSNKSDQFLNYKPLNLEENDDIPCLIKCKIKYKKDVIIDWWIQRNEMLITFDTFKRSFFSIVSAKEKITKPVTSGPQASSFFNFIDKFKARPESSSSSLFNPPYLLNPSLISLRMLLNP